ncbi:response regulator [Mariprofundus erugo]|uniref:histidine kinase n=1 Tax=Mariprofundus erugo TaxID=2528639 RepID=A0A5R9GSX1_9PROT|nr:histidine kinase dimerization/phospho-acceptor domain-containing protein [Mariprofundus erugo]TLS69010.1 response regulator [Mariprofundus erugo]
MSAMIRIVSVEHGLSPACEIQKALAHTDYQVATTSAENLFTDIAGTHPDAILLPLSLPDCIAVIGRLRSLGPHAIILIAQHDEPLAQALAAGADDYLLAPVSAPLLHHRIHHAITYQRHATTIHELKSQLDAAEAARVRAESASQDFCRDLSHDLNNTLTGMIMTAEMLLMEKPSERTTRVLQEMIELADEIDSSIKTRRAAMSNQP